MDNIWLSVVVAAYNVEKYISEALLSLLNQIDNNVEIIVVNDGSKDNTLVEIEKVRDAHAFGKQLRIIDQSNSGVSEARNTGLKQVSGKYIAFLDGDDHVAPNYYKKLVDSLNLSTCEPDIVEFNATRFSSLEEGAYINATPFRVNVCGNYCCTNDQETLTRIFSHAYWFPWARIYKAELFEGLRFPPGKSYEDMMLIPQLYLRADYISGIDEALIGYRVNFEGITRNPSSKDLSDIELIIDHYLNMSALEDDLFKKKMMMLVACQGALFYKSISNDMSGYFKSIKDISRVVKKVNRRKRNIDISVPFNTRMLFLSPALSNFYSYIKKSV